MNQREFFTVAIRILGVWQLLECANELVAWVNLYTRQSSSSIYLPNAYLIHTGVYFITGFYLLFMSSGLIDAFYPVAEPIIPSTPSQDSQ